MNYSVFLLTTNTTKGAIFLFNFRKQPQLRPRVGDVLTEPFTFQEFKILIDDILEDNKVIFRITDGGKRRITDNGDARVIQFGKDIENVSHLYYVTPANNPKRISSNITNSFDDDKTLRQLFR